ncbi:hypothetical protein BDV98DRAFT_584190 [Pterulicium gracile]|uniref:BTB domain-containing protein n=1 Tax=Pterulicium gracile TaxID=1884261 RepID=A0A5C3QBZ7_9AGAR|nr:hypothetical protein BDV98DRAFT_584190 [Pterula gracilis]
MDSESASVAQSSESKPLWWDNSGVIVIKAGDTLFRASRAILTKESGVFASIRTREIHTWNLELADSAEDMQRFLDATHLYREYYESPKSQTFPNIASILRLSTKYDVPHLRERAGITGIHSSAPTTQTTSPLTSSHSTSLARRSSPKLLPLIMDDIIRVTTTTDIMFGKPHPTKVGTRTEITGAEDKRILFAALPKLSAAQIAANLSLVSPTYGQLSLRPEAHLDNKPWHEWRQVAQRAAAVRTSGSDGFGSSSTGDECRRLGAL